MPFVRGRAKTGGRQRGTPNKMTREIRGMARQLLEDPAYRRALRRRLLTGRAPHVETLLFHYAYGKPSERAEAGDAVRAIVFTLRLGEPGTPEASMLAGAPTVAVLTAPRAP